MLMPEPRQEVSLGRRLSDSESSSCFATDKWLRRRWRDGLGFGVLGSLSQWGATHTTNVRSEDFSQFTKAQAVLFRIW